MDSPAQSPTQPANGSADGGRSVLPPEVPFEELVQKAIETDEIRSAAREASLSDDDLRQALAEQPPWPAIESELANLRSEESNLAHARGTIDQRAKVGLPLTVEIFDVSLTFNLRAPRTRKRRQRVEARRRAALEADINLAANEREIEQARSVLIAALYDRGILAPLRRFIESSAAASWSTVLSIDEAPGLAELSGVEPVVTEMVTELASRIERMPGGSIGISGPRGVGKTTLMRLFTQSRSKPLRIGVRVSAPTKYDGREFVLHLFGRLCDEVRRASGEATRSVITPSALARPRSANWFDELTRVLPVAALVAGLGLLAARGFTARVDPQFLIGLACVALSAGLARAAFSLQRMRYTTASANDLGGWLSARIARRQRIAGALLVALVGAALIAVSQLESHIRLWVLGGALVAAGYLLQASRVFIGPVFREGDSRGSPCADGFETIVARASDHARGIRFQQTVAAGWSATAKTPVLEGAITGSRSLQEMPLSFPQVTEAFTEFIQALAKHAQVIVGIDELDKMEADETPRFLNDIKGVFGVRECFFLVSVSEEAMSNFTRRDARLRDVFDSAFDDIVQMRRLRLVDSQKIMADRVTRLPRPFLALCHVLSGGLARDLIREARTLFSLKQTGVDAKLSELAHAVLTRELSGRQHAATIAVRSLNVEPQTSHFLRWLASIGTSVEALEDICGMNEPWRTGRHAPTEAQEMGEIARLMMFTRELQGFAYFSASVLRFFDDSLDRQRLEEDPLSVGGGGSVDDLASARHAFGSNLAAAWEQTTAFRTARKLPSLSFPLSVADE